MGGGIQRQTGIGAATAFVAIVFALLPYVRTSPLPSDIQPHFLVAFALYLPVCIWRFQTQAPYLASLAIGALYALAAVLLRAYEEALAIFFLPAFTMALAYEDRALVSRAVKTGLVVYAIGAALQFMGATGLLESAVSNLRISEQRGYTSFASEPSYLSIVALVGFTWCLYMRERWWWPALCVLLALLSGSVAGLAPLALIAFLFAVRGLNLLRVAGFAALAGFVIYATANVVDPNSRLAILTTTVLRDPFMLLSDVSATNRIIRSFGPVYLAWEDGFMPHSYPAGADLYINWAYFSTDSDTFVDRLSNIASVLTYIFGFLALPLVVIAIRYIRAPLYVVATAAYLVFTNISIATPYTALVFALLYRARVKHA